LPSERIYFNFTPSYCIGPQAVQVALPLSGRAVRRRGAMVQALGLSFTVATLALAVRLQASAQFGWWSASVAWSVCGALAAAFAGLKLGEVLRGRLAGPAFQKGAVPGLHRARRSEPDLAG